MASLIFIEHLGPSRKGRMTPPVIRSRLSLLLCNVTEETCVCSFIPKRDKRNSARILEAVLEFS